MKKQYITPSIKSVNVVLNQSLLATSDPKAYIDSNQPTTTTQLTNGFRRNQWSSGWDD